MSIMEDKVSCHEGFVSIKHTRDTIKLLQVIKQLMNSIGSEELHTVHNQFIATINLFRMSQERGQLPQIFREQFTAMRQVCIGQSDQGAWAILKKEGVTNPTNKKLEDLRKKAAEEYFAILFLYLADRQQYGKILEHMIHYLEKNFLKNVSDACRLLTSWCNNYGGQSICTEANGGVAFTSVSDDKEEPKK